MYEIVLCALAAELTLSAEAQKLVAAVAKQTLRSLIPQVHVVACKLKGSPYAHSGFDARQLTMILAIDIVHLLIF